MSVSPNPVLLLDLDRTLFDTDRYTAALLGALAPQIGVSAEILIAEVPGQYVASSHGGGSYYDMIRHLQAYGASFDDIKRCVAELPNDYLFPDAASLLNALRASRREAQLLTHGEHKAQSLKLAVCQPLGHMAAHITLQPKGLYIANKWPNSGGMIVDDKDIADIPEGWTGVRINRSASASVEELIGRMSFQIASLDYVLPLFDRLYTES